MVLIEKNISYKIKTMTGACMRWCCYDDPYDKQCTKIVIKNKKYVRCQRTETKYCKKNNSYFCEKHYLQYNYLEENKLSLDSSEESDCCLFN